MLHTVNAFMLRSMIHECPLDILHSGDQEHISQKQCQFHKSLRHSHSKFRSSDLTEKACQCIRKQHKSRYGDNNGNRNRYVQKPLELLCFLLFLGRKFFLRKFRILCCFFLVLLVSGNLCRVHEALGSDYKSVHKADHTTNDRFLKERSLAEGALVILNLQFYFFIRTAYCNCIFVLVAHHDAFHYRLSADI